MSKTSSLVVLKVLLKRLESASWRVTKKRDIEKEAERPLRTLKCGLLYQTGGSNFRRVTEENMDMDMGEKHNRNTGQK
jgi:hypothetical protein